MNTPILDNAEYGVTVGGVHALAGDMPIIRLWARLETRFGTIEYADRGEGVPLLVSHGVLGCHVDTVDGWWAGLLGPGFRVIGPSRFGYFGSTLPKDATPADQADA